MTHIAFAIVILFALWICGAGVFAVVAPARALGMIGRFATGWRINAIEQAGRALAGIALVLHAPAARTYEIFTWAGWAITLSAVALMVLPLRWHFTYAQWWSNNLPQWTVRALGFVAIALAAWLIWSALG